MGFMPKRISKKLTDTNEIASAVLAAVTSQTSKIVEKIEHIEQEAISRVMAAMGPKGGKIGGKRRLETMSSDERTRIAKGAAKARWAKRNTK